MWQAVRDWVLKYVRVHGNWHTHEPLVNKTTQEYRCWQKSEREGPDSKSFRITSQAALTVTLLPKGFTETVPWNCDYFTHTSEQSVSRVLWFQRKTLSVQTSFTQGNDAKHCHIYYTNQKKISVMCVLDINMALSLKRTSRSMKREKKSQDRKRRMMNRRPKETITSWFSPWTFRWSCWLHVHLQIHANYYKTKLCCHDFTIYNLSNRDVVCYFWHDFTIYNLSNRDVVCYCHDFTIYNLSNRDVVCYFWHDFTIYNLSNRDVVCYFWHDFTIYNLSNRDVVCYCHDFTIYNLSNRDVVCYFWHDFTIYNLSNRDVVCYCHDFTIYNLSNRDVVCYFWHDFTIYNLSNRDVVCYFWHEMNGELKNSNFASCIFGSSSQWWMILSAQWFCTETGAAIRIVMLPCPVQCPHSLCCVPKEDHLSEISWKGAHLDGGWICTLCNWRQTQGAPDILASRVHWCNNCRKKRPSLWSQTSGPHFLQRLLQAEFLF